jgi:hypothetical protein
MPSKKQLKHQLKTEMARTVNAETKLVYYEQMHFTIISHWEENNCHRQAVVVSLTLPQLRLINIYTSRQSVNVGERVIVIPEGCAIEWRLQ